MGEELPQGWCQPGGEQQARGGGELVGRHSGPKQVSHRALSVPGQSTRVLSFLLLIMCGFICHFLSVLFSCQFFKSFTHLPTRVKRYHLHIVYFHSIYRSVLSNILAVLAVNSPVNAGY